ncbi:MAG: FxsA family protein [Hyphomicrobiaceae bacterium]
MRLTILLLFVAVPLIELALLIELGRQIGFWWTIGIVIFTAFAGTAVLQQQGLQTLGRINESMASGVPPIEPVVEGFFLVIAGAFLLTPGILTDTVGFLLLVPPLRRMMARWSFDRIMATGSVYVRTAGRRPESDSSRAESAYRPRPDVGDGPIIDGDFQRVEDPKQDRPPHHDVGRGS